MLFRDIVQGGSKGNANNLMRDCRCFPIYYPLLELIDVRRLADPIALVETLKEKGALRFNPRLGATSGRHVEAEYI